MNIMDFTDKRVNKLKKIIESIDKSIEKKREQLRKSLRQLDKLESVKPVWSAVQQMDKASVPTKTIGVYKIIYKPTKEVMSIGQGNVSGRRTRHLSVFKNKGRDISSVYKYGYELKLNDEQIGNCLRYIGF